MSEAKVKGQSIQAKAMEHRSIYEKKFAELKTQRLQLQEEARNLQGRITAHETAEVQLQARWAALSELLEGVDPIPGATEPGTKIEAPGLPHKDAEAPAPAAEAPQSTGEQPV